MKPMLSDRAAFFAVALQMAFVAGGFGEYRIWTDDKGKNIEAEYVCESMGRVVLRDRDGNDHRVLLDSLSQADQKYLRRTVPPNVSIVFSKAQDRRRQEFYSDVDMQCTVEIKKTSRLPCEGELKAVLFVIGDATRNREYVMLDRTEASFNFRDSDTFSFKGALFRMRQYDSEYHRDDGVEYRGFLVVVYDATGKAVAAESSSDDFKANIQQLARFKTGSHFGKDMQSRTNIRVF